MPASLSPVAVVLNRRTWFCCFSTVQLWLFFDKAEERTEVCLQTCRRAALGRLTGRGRESRRAWWVPETGHCAEGKLASEFGERQGGLSMAWKSP